MHHRDFGDWLVAVVIFSAFLKYNINQLNISKMTEINKLELKYLSPYLPFALKAKTKYYTQTISAISNDFVFFEYAHERYDFDEIKPILRPMYGISDDVKVFEKLSSNFEIEYFGNMLYKDVEILLENHYDVFGLIEEGFAYSVYEASQNNG